MPLLGRRQLPATSYGYLPPPEAVARGWHCASRDCGAVGDEIPRRWPYPCRRCGGPTDPALPEPWQHAARGVEIQHLLAHGVEDGGFTQMEWPLWQYAEASRVGDAAAARRARADVRALDDARRAEHGRPTHYGWCKLVWHELDAGDLDGAGEDLVHWLGVSSAEDVEHDNDRRTNCRQAIAGALRFLDAAGPRGHPLVEPVRTACLALATGAYPVLGLDVQQAIARLARA